MIESKEYVLEVHCSNEWVDDAPDRARVLITRERAERIIKLARLVRNNELWCVEEWNCLPQYGWVDWDVEDENGNPPIRWDDEDSEEHFRTECDRLVVMDRDFQFECYPKHQDNAELITEHIKIKDLAADFGITFEEQHP